MIRGFNYTKIFNQADFYKSDQRSEIFIGQFLKPRINAKKFELINSRCFVLIRGYFFNPPKSGHYLLLNALSRVKQTLNAIQNILTVIQSPLNAIQNILNITQKHLNAIQQALNSVQNANFRRRRTPLRRLAASARGIESENITQRAF